MDSLDAINPLDGRYRKSIEQLASVFSERGLIKKRIEVEGEYLIALSESLPSKIRKFSDAERSIIRDLYSEHDGLREVKELETIGKGGVKATNHDIKAVEYFMKGKLRGTSLEDSLEWIHFALTSEDTNNIAYGLMLRDAVEEILNPSLEEITSSINQFAKKYAKTPMIARTHGQPASPTTLGKEFRNFGSRLERQMVLLENQKIMVKLNGATGNYNAHCAAFPDFDWIGFSKNFIGRFNRYSRMKLAPNLLTTQIEPHDSYAELFHNLSRINTVLIGFDQDIWRYISDDWLKQKPKEGEIGSSTMPHKINPIDFENSEGNLGMANSLFSHFSSKLPISRLQRDLSDSTVERNFGTAFGYSLVGYKSLLRGLGKTAVDENRILNDLYSHPEVIAEAMQTVLRREGIPLPYEQLKELTCGKKIKINDLRKFVESLNIPDSVKAELKMFTPQGYTGKATYLADNL